MSFCLECGTPLAVAPVVFNLRDSNQAPNQSAPETAFNRSTETVFGAQPFPANFAAETKARPKSNKKKIFLVIAGIFSLFGMMLAAGALIVYFNWKSNKAVDANANANAAAPAPTRGLADKSPSPRSSASPIVSPSASPTVSRVDSPQASPLPTPEASFTPPVEPTKKGTFTIYANGGWQLSEIDTVPLENFRTSAAGLIDLAGIKTSVSPSGIADAKTKSRRIYPEYPTGALMMRTRYADGKYSNVQPVTAAPSVGIWQNFPEERGRLEFCINDNVPEGNGGHFTVTKTSTGVPKAKK
jgi:hypothetical protein